MASGKQLSFQYGEVSPSLRYRSDAVSYASGLGKLTNMFVRRAGGVSNRPGLEFVEISEIQTNIPAVGGPAGIKGFVYWSPIENKYITIQYANFGTEEDPSYQFMIDGDTPEDPEDSFAIDGKVIGPKPNDIRFTVLKNRVFVTPELQYDIAGGDPVINVNVAIIKGMDDDEYTGNEIDSFYGYTASSTVLVGETLSFGYSGTAPFLPVSYLVTATLEDGKEIIVGEVGTTGYDPATWDSNAAPGANIVHPHPALSTNVTLEFASGLGDRSYLVKFFSLYRAAGAGGTGGSFFKLAGRALHDKSNNTVTFQDYGADDPSITPPIDNSMYVDSGFRLSGVVGALYYQQRLLMLMRPGVVPGIKTGDILATKLGAPDQVRAPVVYSNTGAFQFSIPITDGTPPIAGLSMERAIIGTERGTYVLRGGEQGVLTPSTVNPLQISEEGFSKIVEPKFSGRRGYFLNNAHNKLMAIEFGADGNLDVRDASIFSDHFLIKDIVQLEVLGGGEDTVYLLRRDGKLVRITASDDGAHGFCLIETDGYIESIYRGKSKRHYAPNYTDISKSERDYDVLMVYTIRNGVRLVEKIGVRDDIYKQGELFADLAVRFGVTLSDNGNAGYYKVADDYAPYMNISSATTWTAGSALKIQVSATEDYTYDYPDVVHMYYDDEDGNEQMIRLFIDNDSEVATGNPLFNLEYDVYSDQDIPLVLQNVRGQSVSQIEKNRRLSRWLPAYNQVDPANLYPFKFMMEDPEGSGEVEVSIVGEGEIISSPLNPHKTTLTVEFIDGVAQPLDLTDYFAWGYVGIPYISEMESLDLETAGQRTLTDSRKILNAVGVGFLESRGGFYGMPGQELTDMQEFRNETDGDFADQVKNMNGHAVIPIPASWQEAGRINIKHVDPSPLTVLAIYPKGLSGDYGQ